MFALLGYFLTHQNKCALALNSVCTKFFGKHTLSFATPEYSASVAYIIYYAHKDNVITARIKRYAKDITCSVMMKEYVMPKLLFLC